VLAPVVILGAEMCWSDRYLESDGEPGRWHYDTSQDGYTDNERSLFWLRTCFEPQTAAKAKGNWHLLICDGHGSHEMAYFISFCFWHQIFVLCLLAHMSHLTQPLDDGCFGPLKQFYYQLVKEASDEGTKKINKQLLIKLYKKAQDNAFTVQKDNEARKHAGLFPLNSKHVIVRACSRPSTPPAQLSTSRHNIPTTPKTLCSVVDVR
jgi:serine/threonine protein phosphatase PrpC